MNANDLALVAIARDEKPFLDEWLLYHRTIGVDRVFLYDDEPDLSLGNFCSPHRDYVTVIPLHDRCKKWPGSCRQLKAYNHSLAHFLPDYRWAAFLDVDEFIVLRQHDSIKDLLLTATDDVRAMSLHWRLFGHNGFFDDPKDLVTSSLARRKLETDCRVKTISRCDSIAEPAPHYCTLKHGIRADIDDQVAHINHYQCRSFARYISRIDRGNCGPDSETDDLSKVPKSLRWKKDKELCLRHFVEHVALNHNEHIDKYMLKYKPALDESIKQLRPRT